MSAADECARCFRSRDEHEHEHQDDNAIDDVQRRIWRALGAPCAAFADTLGHVFAENQARSARRPARHVSHETKTPDPRKAASAARGAALARQLLAEGRR